MLYDLGVWLAGLLLVLPLLVLAASWVKVAPFHQSNAIRTRQRIVYYIGLSSGTMSTIAYLAYWIWRICAIYHATFPFTVLLNLDGLIFACRLLGIFSIVALLLGRGPYRVALALGGLWVTAQLWMHDGIIHWA